MALLSTLRPLGTLLWDNFWWILSYLPAPAESQMTFSQFNDDCLLLILGHLTFQEVLQLRPVCRRLCHLIEGYRLQQYKTLLYGYSPAERKQREDGHSDGQQVEVYCSTRHDAYMDFNRRTSQAPLRHIAFYSRPRRLFPLKLSAFPRDLPLLLPRLSSLTFTYYLSSRDEPLLDEQVAVNQNVMHYLRSSWSSTLVSLHLYLQVPARVYPYHVFFEQLNKLTALKHLFLEFTGITKMENVSLLPTYMPILGQLTSFSLVNYRGFNTVMLLQQLGPNLTFLSLYNIVFSEGGFAAFLTGKPTYRHTLNTLEVFLHNEITSQQFYQPFTVCAQNLLSLESFVGPCIPVQDLDIVSYFADLNRLPNLHKLTYVPLYIDQLRALRELHHRSGALPRLSSIRRANIVIFHEEEVFQIEELDSLLPPLADIFCNLNYLGIGLYRGFFFIKEKYSESQSLKMLNKANQLFMGLRFGAAIYYE